MQDHGAETSKSFAKCYVQFFKTVQELLEGGLKNCFAHDSDFVPAPNAVEAVVRTAPPRQPSAPHLRLVVSTAVRIFEGIGQN